MFGWLFSGFKVRSYEIENAKLRDELTKYKCLDVTQKDVLIVIVDELMKCEKELQKPKRSRDTIMREACLLVEERYHAKLSTRLRRQMNLFSSIIDVMIEHKKDFNPLTPH